MLWCVSERRKRRRRRRSQLEREVQPGMELQERIPSSSSPTSSSSSSGPAAGGRWSLRSRIQSCEDDVSKAMKLIQELHNQRDHLKEEMKELHHQHKMVGAPTEPVTDVEQCCRRVDALEEAVSSLRDTFQKYPDPEELSQCVSWDVMQSTLLSERENLQKELVNSGVVDPATVDKPTLTSLNLNITAVKTAPSHTSASSSPPDPGEVTSDTAAPGSPSVSGQISPPQEATDTLPGAPEASSVPSEPKTRPAAGVSRKASGSGRYQETVEALRNIGKLKERFNKLEARVVALETENLDKSELTHLRELIANKGSQDASNNLMDQLNQQRALIDGLMSDREKLDDLRGTLEEMMLSLTSELSCSLEDDESDGQELGQSTEKSTFTSSTVNVGRKLSRLFQHYELLQEAVNSLLQQQTAGRAGPLKDVESVELVDDVQKAILQLQAECERLHETTQCLHEDNRQKQSHIEELYKTTEELEEKKADKQMVESEIKADKSALDSKVSRLQFDSVTEQLNAMFHELLNKVTGQEQDWQKVIDRLSTEMECKLNRIELDSVKKQLEGRWKNIHEKLQAQGPPEHDDAAGLRKQLVDRFHCLSCDRPVVKYTPGPNSNLVRLPSTPGFPAHKSIRPFTVYALEQFRQHYRSERISELTDYSHLTVLRSCGGSHTVTSANQRRTGLQSTKHHPPQTEVDAVIQSQEIDIVGMDGHIYKGRLNAPANRSTETKLPTIATKDGKTKDKAKCSHKPAVSPEAGHGAPLHLPHSAKSAQCSRSASSSSGRDWPVSALGCTSQSSLTPASAAAESTAEPRADEPVSL
ncbi:glutamine-rich protein 2 isoform X1 [Dicentrarchus labrax]|uniref:glutamine-rich protein 2 isoform X1 n=1 Tax=Dicentrarchus labrax TaxID=13489 RepID=UPI0021F5038E|nr:glutamine-rich protein 2 isoform X1 [Dicentrarchus labrax]